MKVPGKSVLVRAFELAQSGSVTSIKTLHKALKSEGYTIGELSAHLQGNSLRRQLKLLMTNAPH